MFQDIYIFVYLESSNSKICDAMIVHIRIYFFHYVEYLLVSKWSLD